MECRIRLVSLAAQRYISEVISVATNYNKLRRESEKPSDVRRCGFESHVGKQREGRGIAAKGFAERVVSWAVC